MTPDEKKAKMKAAMILLVAAAVCMLAAGLLFDLGYRGLAVAWAVISVFFFIAAGSTRSD